MHPRRALILAAGLGSRLRPITWSLPKPLVPIWGTPSLDLAIQTLLSWGVEEFAINISWLSEEVEAHLRHRWPSLPIRVSRETEILGTGGALLPLRDFFSHEESFWIYNADVIASMDGQAFAEQHARSGAFASLWMTESDGPRSVDLAPDGLVQSFLSTHPGTPGTASFCGVQIVSGRFYEFLSDSIPSSSISAYQRALEAGERVVGVLMPHSFWADSGKPKSYHALHRAIRRLAAEGAPGKEFYNASLDQGNEVCAEASSLSASAEVEDSILFSGSHVAPGVQLRHSIVGPNTHVSASRENAVLVRPEGLPEPRILSAIEALHWSPPKTAVETLEARGSDRTFYRMQHEGKRVILAVHGLERPENDTYAALANTLSNAGIRVPSFLAQSTPHRWVVMDDLGDTDLLSAVHSTAPDAWEALYQPVLQTVIDLHVRGRQCFASDPASPLLQPPFSESLYSMERDLFATHFCRGTLHLSESETAALLEELKPCAKVLLDATPVLVHRDLQSTNVFLFDGAAWLIDFQGARWGAAAYDLASLLCDPYVQLSSPLRARLLEEYASRVPWGEETRCLFPFAAIQRLIQALGAYGRLSALPGTSRFAVHIAPATKILLDILAPLPGFTRLRQTLSSRS